MSKKLTFCLLLTGSLSCSLGPSWADTGLPASLSPSEPAERVAAAPVVDAATGSTGSPATKASPGKKLFSIIAATVIGTPVCMVRRTKYEESYGVKGMIGDSDRKASKLLAGVFWLPNAIVCGVAEAPFDAFANALMYPAFSKDQLSEGKLIQNN